MSNTDLRELNGEKEDQKWVGLMQRKLYSIREHFTKHKNTYCVAKNKDGIL